ncbi:MAG TPA: HAD-IC family P-type ATPase, partial [Planctomycetia bacterium]|nr:HAD-IC family P-type ATPase [Planctomycetia bacterium]
MSSYASRILIALLAAGAIAAHLTLRATAGLEASFGGARAADFPLFLALALGGAPLVGILAMQLVRRDFGSDLLAGISIVTSVLLGEYLAGVLVVLMLSGGQALEGYAVRQASSVLQALARRMPRTAHRKVYGVVEDAPLEKIAVGDTVVVFPHETCPVDGTVVEGHGAMDESYLTGEPYVMSKAPGAAVLSGAINGEAALSIRADRLAVDSRYAKIMQVMRESEQRRPRLRRLGDQLGAFYTPLALAIAAAAWLASGDPVRFLAVLVVATPCPLLIAIPVAVIGSVSLAARRGIIVKDPAILEKLSTCRTALFDKTGTLTYGQPHVTATIPAAGFGEEELLAAAASLERYSRHPLAAAVLAAAVKRRLELSEAEEVSERPGEGLRGIVRGRRVQIAGRKKLHVSRPELAASLPLESGGMECVVLVDEKLAGTLQFRDEPRADGRPFIRH